MAFIIKRTLNFYLPSGFFHIRVLAVGGGGAGCRRTTFAFGQASVPEVDIVHLPGNSSIKITVGSGGTNLRESTSSQFGKYLESKGGKECHPYYYTSVSVEDIKGIDKFQLSKITKGQHGKNGNNTKFGGGQGGVLINGEGPTALPGSSEGSGQGGNGFGAGGGSIAKSYQDEAFNRGGDGAPGVVYFELSTGCDEDVQIMMASESVDDSLAFNRQLEYINYIFTAINDPNLHAKAGLVEYRGNVSWIFMPGHHNSLAAMKNATTNALLSVMEGHPVNFKFLFDRAYEFFSGNSSRKRSLVIFTSCARIQNSKNLEESKKKLLELPVSIIVVNAHLEPNSCDKTFLTNLTSDKNHVFDIANDTQLNRSTPWIVDLICAGRKFSPTKTSAANRPTELFHKSTVTRKVVTAEPTSLASVKSMIQLSTTRLNLVSKTVTTVISPRISFSSSSVMTHIDPTPVKVANDSLIREKTKVLLSLTTTTLVPPSFAITPSRVSETTNTASVQSKQITGFQRLLNLNIFSLNINDTDALQTFMDLCEKLLFNKWEDGNMAKRLQVLKIVELAAFHLAKQLTPDVVKGYSTLNLQSGSIALIIHSVTITQGKVTNVTSEKEKVVIPMSVFSTTKNAVGHMMAFVYPPFDEMSEPNSTVVSSRIINVAAKPIRTPPFETPVEIVFPIDEKLKEDSRCLFWNINESFGLLRDKSMGEPYDWWDERGCKTYLDKPKYVKCHGNHLTNFAVITRVNNYQRPKKVEQSLTIITYVGFSLSFLGCVLTLATYKFLPSLRSDRTTVTIQLVLALFVGQTFFLVGSIVGKQNKSLCFFVAVATYYFYLSVFTWMLVEGAHIYCKVVKVYQSNQSRKKIYFLFGWGSPALATILTASTFREKFVSSKRCWLSIESGAIWTFVGPVLFVILVNFIILYIVMRISARVARGDRNSSSRAAARGFVALLPVLGLTWLFGVLAVSNSTVVFEYIFAIFNTLQGFLIFVFCCVINTEVQREFRRKMSNIQARRNPSFTPTLSRSSHHNSSRRPDSKSHELTECLNKGCGTL